MGDRGEVRPDAGGSSRRSLEAAGVPRVIWIIAGLGVALGLGLLASAYLLGRIPQPAPTLAVGGIDVTSLGGRPAPDFSLIDQFGRRRSLSKFRGCVVILTFIDSRCTTICPLTAEMLRQVQHLLGPSATEVQLLAVNANPKYASVADVRRWSKRHGMLHRWVFLTGAPSELRRVWASYFVTSTFEPNGEVSHIPAVYVIDKRGGEQDLLVVRSGRASLTSEASAIASRVRPLLGA